MSRKAIYTYTSMPNLLAGQGYNRIFSLPANNRQLKISSVFIDLQIREAVGGKILPFAMNRDIQFILTIGPGAGNPPISSCFSFTGAPPIVNGSGFVFVTPGQYRFDNFFITNELPMDALLQNNGAITYSMIYSVAVEVEENIIWQTPKAETYRIEE